MTRHITLTATGAKGSGKSTLLHLIAQLLAGYGVVATMDDPQLDCELPDSLLGKIVEKHAGGMPSVPVTEVLADQSPPPMRRR